MQLSPGLAVTDSIRLVEPLSEGGMGSVWIAEHSSLQTRVAVKFLASALLQDDPTMVARFRREASAAAQIKSPHVVQTLDHGVMANGVPYMVMELLEGEDLRQRIEGRGPLDPLEVAEILSQVAKALGKAHAVGIIHRDVKPDNIFLVDAGDEEIFVKVLDFGVAKHTGPQTYSVVTSTGAMVGTPGYMSPEQVLHGANVDLRTDLWSLGVVTYHALVGAVPFEGETLGALCVAITRGVFVPPSQRRPQLPPAIDGWMARALALDRDERFASARELADCFREAVGAADASQPDRATTRVWQRPSEVAGAREPSLATARTLPSSPGIGSLPAAPGAPKARPRPRVRLAVAIALLGFAIGFAAVVAFVESASPTSAADPPTDGDGAVPSGDVSASAPDERPEQPSQAPEPSASASSASVARAPASASAVAQPPPRASVARPRPAPRPPPPSSPPPPRSPEPEPKDRGF